MADKYLNLTAVQTIKTWAKGLFALDADLDALDAKVDEIISEGGEPNVIETVKVNGTALPVTQKAVDVEVPTKTSDLTNDGDGESNFATEEYVAENGGKIDVIKVNGTAQAITNKAVDIPVPTKTSDLTNDSDYQTSTNVTSAIETALANNGDPYQTEGQVDEKINDAIVGALKPKGSCTFEELPTPSAAVLNNMYDVSNAFTTTDDFKEGAGHRHSAGTNVAVINAGTDESPVYKYDVMPGPIDLAAYWTSTPGEENTLEAATVAEIEAILNA